MLGVYSGTGQIRLDGSNGIITEGQSGDVIVIPAGVGHENLRASANFGVMDAYPSGQTPDVQKREFKEHRCLVTRPLVKHYNMRDWIF